MSLQDTVTDFFKLLAKGETLEAIRLYYHDDAVQIEFNGTVSKGKAALLKEEEQKIAAVNWFSIAVPAYAVNEATGTVAGEMNIEFETLKGKKKRIEEAFVQKWENKKLIYQRFYYNSVTDAN
jgi:ketosteroid isomerase-like protein